MKIGDLVHFVTILGVSEDDVGIIVEQAPHDKYWRIHWTQRGASHWYDEASLCLVYDQR